MSEIEYRLGNNVAVGAVIELLNASTLGERRPVGDPAAIRTMLEHANLLVTAWDEGLMVGLARTLTDFVYVGYMSDLAVRASHQRRGIGVELVRRTRDRMGPRSRIVLLAAPQAVGYYPRIGFSRHESAWILGAADALGHPPAPRC